jgi:hypothetical protein
MTNKALTLRPATPEDRFRIRRWLAEPEIQAWWGNAASAEAEINLAMASDTALCRIVEADGAPVGYAHAVEIGVWGAPPPRRCLRAPWDIDLFIASQSTAGVGSAELRSPFSPRRHSPRLWLWRAAASYRSGTRPPCGLTSRRASAGGGFGATRCSGPAG